MMIDGHKGQTLDCVAMGGARIAGLGEEEGDVSDASRFPQRRCWRKSHSVVTGC